MNKIKIKKDYFNALSKIFSPVVLNSITATGHSGYLSEVYTNSGLNKIIDTEMTLGYFFEFIYNFLLKNYRNEYIYKNAIANKILLGKHSLNTSRMLSEFRVGKCKADVVLLNGTSTVYEIKSEFDSFLRLENQVNSYLKIFDHINVITSANQTEKLFKALPANVGILSLTKKYTIAVVRESSSNKMNIVPDVLFNSLRKDEYLNIICKYFGKTPDTPNTKIFDVCKKLFNQIPIESLHELTIESLKKRSNAKLLKEFLEAAPKSLTAYGLSISNDKNKLNSIIDKLSLKMSSVLNVSKA